MCMPGDNTYDGRADRTRSPWTRASASPSARVAAPSAPAASPRSSSRGADRWLKANEKRVRGHPRVHRRASAATTSPTKNKVNDRERIEMKKYCRWDRTHTRPQGDPLTVDRRPTSRNARRRPGSNRRDADRPVRPSWSPPPATGDQEAFEELVRRHVRRHVHAGLRLTGNEEDARDVVQESYLRAYRGLEALPRRRAVLDLAVPDHRELRRAPTSASGRGTATTSSPTTRRRRRPTPSATPRPGPTPPSCATASRTRSSDLPPKLRAVVVLRDVYDLPHEAIAAELGHLRVGGQGPAPPGPPQAARDACSPAAGRGSTTRRSPMRCDDLADGARRGGRRDRRRRPRRPPPRRALPAVPGRAGAVPQAAAGAAHPAHRGARAGARPAGRASSPTSRRRASATPSARCSTGRRVAYAGGLAAATAAGAAGAIVLAASRGSAGAVAS